MGPFDDPRPDQPPATYTPPDILARTKPIKIHDVIPEPPPKNPDVGPGRYNPKFHPAEPEVRTVVWRKDEPERDIWGPELKRQAQLPDSGSYRPRNPGYASPRRVVWRKEGGSREIWPHLKEESQLPEASSYWEVRPFYVPPPASPVRKFRC